MILSNDKFSIVKIVTKTCAETNEVLSAEYVFVSEHDSIETARSVLDAMLPDGPDPDEDFLILPSENALSDIFSGDDIPF